MQIDRETKKKLREMEQEEKMKKPPVRCNGGDKEYQSIKGEIRGIHGRT